MSSSDSFEEVLPADQPAADPPPPPPQDDDSDTSSEEDPPMDGNAAATATKVDIPKFSGEGADPSEDCRAWLTAIEEYFAATRTPAEDQAKQLTFAFRPTNSKAFKWWTKILQRKKDNVQNWDAAKRIIKDRFYARSTPSEVAVLLRSLQQRPDEDVRSFLDRIDDAMLIAEQEYPLEITGLNENQHKRSLDAYIETQTRLYFISGMHPKLAADVLKQDFTSLQDAEKIARRAEVALKNEKRQEALKTQVVAEATGRFDNSQEEVALLQNRLDQIQGQGRGRGQPRGRGRGFQSSRGRGYQTTSPTPQTGARPRNPLGQPTWLRNEMLPPNTCFRCGHQGHQGRQCVTPENQYNWTNLARNYPQGRQISEVHFQPAPQFQPAQAPMPPPPGLMAPHHFGAPPNNNNPFINPQQEQSFQQYGGPDESNAIAFEFVHGNDF